MNEHTVLKKILIEKKPHPQLTARNLARVWSLNFFSVIMRHPILNFQNNLGLPLSKIYPQFRIFTCSICFRKQLIQVRIASKAHSSDKNTESPQVIQSRMAKKTEILVDLDSYKDCEKTTKLENNKCECGLTNISAV